MRRSVASVLAFVAAIGSFVLTYQARPGWAFVCAVAAVVSGILGFFRSFSPRVGGGVMGLGAIVLGLIAALVALVAAIVK
jgi:hypothetical protein